jgi:hypothetical protein
MPVAVAWNVATARAVYRATMRRIGDWYNADEACQAAWDAHDDAALRQALATWEHAISGGAA